MDPTLVLIINIFECSAHGIEPTASCFNVKSPPPTNRQRHACLLGLKNVLKRYRTEPGHPSVVLERATKTALLNKSNSSSRSHLTTHTHTFLPRQYKAALRRVAFSVVLRGQVPPI